MIGWAERVVAVEHDEQSWQSGVRMNAVSCLIQVQWSAVHRDLRPSSFKHQASAFNISMPATANIDKENAEKNAYEVVAVGSDATEADIKKAYRQRSLKTHPDRVRRPTSRSQSAHHLRFLSRSEPPS